MVVTVDLVVPVTMLMWATGNNGSSRRRVRIRPVCGRWVTVDVFGHIAMRPCFPADRGVKKIARHQPGFTLLEMLAVIILVAIAVTVTAVSVTRGLASARMRAASGELAAALRATRVQAIVRGTQRSFVLDLRYDTYRSANGRTMHLPRGMHLEVTSASMDQHSDGTARIRFFSDGSSTGGRITLRSKHRQWHVNVAWLTGAVHVVSVVQ